jgi:hypothetical protein
LLGSSVSKAAVSRCSNIRCAKVRLTRSPDSVAAAAPARLVSFHAPEVECIGRGKAHAQYEFGVKASIVTTNARAPGGQFVLHAKALPGNPYDGPYPR